MALNNYRFKVIAFDADDTLWDCQSYFENIQRRYCNLLSEYGNPDVITSALFATECSNMSSLGFGAKAFTLSLIENAIALSNGHITSKIIDEILHMGKALLTIPVTPLPGVMETLTWLKARSSEYCSQGKLRLVVFTKGELLDQQGKMERSGLSPMFDKVFIVADKTEAEYLNLCQALDITTSELLMVGNSFRSDIIPAVAVGATAIHIPFHVTWKMEHSKVFTHERIVTLHSFNDIPKVLG